MSQISITGASTGTATFTIESPATSTNRTLTLPDNTGTIITQNSTPAFASTIGVGGATAAASGAGITFPATASASSNANTLDDYEEGTWTPAYSPQSGSFTTLNYSKQYGRYIKIGTMVYVEITLATSSVTVGTASGILFISGLPFTPSSTGDGGVGIVIGNMIRFATALSNIRAYTPNNESVIYLPVMATNDASTPANFIAVSNLTTGASGFQNYVFLSGCYRTAS
jgi:hypothetical protein